MELRIATCKGQPGLCPDDEGLLQALQDAGVEARLVPWQNIAPFGPPILIRTPWDYSHHVPQFRTWLEAIETAGTVCINPAQRMLWNLDKRYLLELEDRGHTIVPTKILQSYSAVAAKQVAVALGWEKAIVKPVTACAAEGLVLLDGHRVETFETTGNTWAPDASLTPADACLLQPFLPQIADGEWSIFYFGGEFSHAVIKRPGAGDIRVQEEHGGSTAPGTAPATARSAADAIVAELEDCTYVRIDGVMQDAQFLLMEVEIIEPELYFRYAPEAMARFAAAVAAKLAATE